jgi:hypothetical protein
VQHALMERLHPEAAARGTFKNFRAAIELYDTYGAGFAYDVMTLDGNPETVKRMTSAYTAAGRYRRLAAVFLAPGQPARLSLIEGVPGAMPAVPKGVIGTRTCSHGCFAGFIEAKFDDHGVFGEMDGKGVFLYATRGAKAHLTSLLSQNRLTLMDIGLLIEHQANFAMLPLTLEQVLSDRGPAAPEEVARFLAEKMVTNIHQRGNCSVVCMQRLPYDLARGALAPDTIQGFAVNQNLARLKDARLVLYDSVGAGMTRSSFLRRA